MKNSAIQDPEWYPLYPEDWKLGRVKTAMESFDSGVWGEDPYDDDSSTPVIRSNELDEGGNWRLTTPALRLLSSSERKQARLREGDLLIVKSSGSHTHIGKSAVVTKGIEDLGSCFSNFTGRIRVLPYRANSKFLWYFLNNSPGRDQLFYYGTTTTGLINLSAKSIGVGIFALPLLPEQQLIVAYLDASCATIDAAVAAKRLQLETFDVLRKSIIQRVVTRGILARVALKSTGNVWMEQIPVGWKLVCLKRIAEIQGGLTLGKQYDGSLIERPYLRVGNVQDGHLDLADVSVIELPASIAGRVELRFDDVLMTEGGDLDKLGRGHLWKGEIPGCLHQNHIFAVRCFLHKLKPMFLAYVTAAKYGRDYFEATGKKTTNLACTNATKVGEFPIPLPPLTEQESICVYLDEKLDELKRIVTNIESQIATLTAYRKSLIHECVTGQRRITEADVRRAQNKRRPT
jgi:type I restriction enzyme S subunit